MDYLATRVRESGKLDEKRGNKVANILFSFVSEVEVVVHYGGLPSLVQSDNVLYDCRTRSLSVPAIAEIVKQK